MRRSGTAWPWMLLLFGSACGDSVVVARGASLVSAAQSSDAGEGDAGADEHPHFGLGGSGGSSNHHPPPTPVPNHSTADKSGTGGSGGTGGSSSTSDSKHH